MIIGKGGEKELDVDKKQRELKSHGTFELPMEFYDCNNNVYKDLYMHWHKEMEVIYVIEGKIFLRLNDKYVEGSTGDFMFIAPETVHYLKSGDEPLRFKSLVFDIRILSGSSDDFCQNKIFHPLLLHQMKISDKITQSDENYENIKSIFFSLAGCCENKKEFYQLEAKHLVFNFFYNIMSGNHYNKISLESNKLTEAVKQAIMYIQDNYTDEITTGSLSEYVHYNEYYFMRVFKKYTGRTIVEFLTEYRLEKSKELLKNEDLTVEDVAYRVGFSSNSYFIRKFRDMFKVTPGEFRKLINKT